MGARAAADGVIGRWDSEGPPPAAGHCVGSLGAVPGPPPRLPLPPRLLKAAGAVGVKAGGCPSVAPGGENCSWGAGAATLTDPGAADPPAPPAYVLSLGMVSVRPSARLI